MMVACSHLISTVTTQNHYVKIISSLNVSCRWYVDVDSTYDKTFYKHFKLPLKEKLVHYACLTNLY